MNLTCATIFALTLPFAIPCQAAGWDYTTNPGSPYPPGCVTTPLTDLELTGPNVALFYSDRIWLETAHKIESSDPSENLGEVQLDMYRVGCAEPNRSVIVAEFTLPPEWVDTRKSQLVLPWLGGNTGFDPYPLEFKAEANNWGSHESHYHFSKQIFGDYTGGWDDARRFAWRYVLDMHPFASYGDRDDAPKYYNGSFSVLFYRQNGEHFLSVFIPSTQALLQPVGRLPLNGRLSGHWVEEGSADQGFLISFSSLVPPPGEAVDRLNSDLLVFLSWFTFDADGKMLWLTGAEQFPQGSGEVPRALDIVRGLVTIAACFRGAEIS